MITVRRHGTRGLARMIAIFVRMSSDYILTTSAVMPIEIEIVNSNTN